MNDATFLLVEASQQKWQPTPFEGVETCVLRIDQKSQSGTALLRFAPGSRFPRHAHPGGEENLVLKGELVFDSQVVGEGDYFYTPPGGAHEVRANKESIVFVSAPGGIKLVE